MVKLFCAIVGAAGSEVEIDNKQSVSVLKEVIKAKNRETIKCDAKDLQLFLAKAEKGDWLSDDDDLEKKLLQNRVDTSKLKALRPTWKLNRVKSPQLFGDDVPLGEDVVHVLVKLTEEQSVPRQTRVHSEIEDQRLMKRQKTTEVEKWEWKDEEPVYSRKCRLFFVNREKAVEDLIEFHETNFYRAKLRSGGRWVIPLLDNVFGLGKSTFRQEYIRKSQSLMPDTTMDEFMKTLCSCHTIPITLNQEQVLDKNCAFDVHLASQSLIGCIWAFFKAEYGVLPHAFDNLEENYAILLTKLTEEVGPLFIVIDEIGLTFDHDKLGNVARRDHFFQFCQVLQPLFENRKLFFLVAGRASFLSQVARRPQGKDSMATSSPFDFKRLHLHLPRTPVRI